MYIVLSAFYDQHLAALYDYFHRNPELSSMEVKTAARLAEELRATGFEVTEGVGGTGIVAGDRKINPAWLVSSTLSILSVPGSVPGKGFLIPFRATRFDDAVGRGHQFPRDTRLM